VEELTLLTHVPLFSRMTDDELQGIHTLMTPQTYPPGQVILDEGERGDTFHVVMEGHVQFIVPDATGHDLVVDEVGTGGFVGELSMLTAEPRVVRAKAVDQVATLALDRSAFFTFLQQHPQAAVDLLMVLGQRLHRVERLLQHSVSRNVNELADEQLTLGQRIADKFASMMGSWRFIIAQSVFLAIWVLLNVAAWVYQWDPYPFILLNLMLSFQAAYASPIIMMSQNRQVDKDRLAAEIDHQVNAKAELEIGLVLSRLDDLERHLLTPMPANAPDTTAERDGH
jgi:CRP/FNR family transcriptional regulator, cyclic AMP receptor protein